jgi:membrane protein
MKNTVTLSSLRRPINFARRVANRLDQAHIGLISAGVAFYAIFAIFPGMTGTIAIWSLVSDPNIIASYLEVAKTFIPPEPYELLNAQIGSLLAGPRATLGWATVLSVLIALFSARAGVSALVQGINVIHRAPTRQMIQGVLAGYAITLALVAITLAAFAIIVIVPIGAAFLPMGLLREWLLTDLPWAAMFALVLMGLGILYRFGPNRVESRANWFSIGAVVAALGWAIGSLGFSYYLANFGAYNRVYGSIGAVVALLMWLYISAYVILVGAAINAERKNRPEPSDQ